MRRQGLTLKAWDAKDPILIADSSVARDSSSPCSWCLLLLCGGGHLSVLFEGAKGRKGMSNSEMALLSEHPSTFEPVRYSMIDGARTRAVVSYIPYSRVTGSYSFFCFLSTVSGSRWRAPIIHQRMST